MQYGNMIDCTPHGNLIAGSTNYINMVDHVNGLGHPATNISTAFSLQQKKTNRCPRPQTIGTATQPAGNKQTLCKRIYKHIRFYETSSFVLYYPMLYLNCPSIILITYLHFIIIIHFFISSFVCANVSSLALLSISLQLSIHNTFYCSHRLFYLFPHLLE